MLQLPLPDCNAERSNAIAVSVRSFRVAGIRGLLNSDEVLTIQTAVRVAMEYQTRGLEAQAEQIYRSILSEAPQHADALHLLGVIFYQKGDANSAVPYIERALATNKSFEGFHNSLGEPAEQCRVISVHSLGSPLCLCGCDCRCLLPHTRAGARGGAPVQAGPGAEPRLPQRGI